VKGDLFGKQQQLIAQLIINKWKKKNAMAGVVFQAVRGYKNPPKPNGGKKNKVEPQPSTSSDYAFNKQKNNGTIIPEFKCAYCLSYDFDFCCLQKK
jgi:hypothetical protein